MVAAQPANRAVGSLVAWCDAKLLVTELDPSVPAAQDFVEEWLYPRPRWHLVAYDEGGTHEHLLDTL